MPRARSSPAITWGRRGCSSSRFREANPETAFLTLVIDGSEEDRGTAGIGEVLLPQDLSIPTETLDLMMSMYDVMEFATALKPALLMELLRTRARVALYFDPDIAVFAPLDGLFDAADQHGIVLTPHVLQPMPRDGLSLDERSIMLAGIYNLGFIGVSAASFRFLSWWNERLRFDAVSDPAKALFTDQRWIDWVPSVFPHEILRDPGCNVAYWNLHERVIEETAAGWNANGSPLRFLHFSGYDPALPWLLSKHPGDNPRVLLSDRPELRRLCAAYGAALERHGATATRLTAYAHAQTPAGLTLTLPIRRLIRAVVKGEVVPTEPMPLAFAEADEFARWLLRPAFGDPRLMLRPVDVALWLARVDLQNAFPDVFSTTTAAFGDWTRTDPEALAAVRAVEAVTGASPAETVDPGPSVPLVPDAWRVIDLTSPGTEEGEAAIRMIAALRASGRFFADDRATENILVVAEAGAVLPLDVQTIVGTFAERRVLALLGGPKAVVTSPALRSGLTELWVVGERTAEAVAPVADLPVSSAPLAGTAAMPVTTGNAPTVLIDAQTRGPLDRTGAARAARAAAAAREQFPGLRVVVLVGGRSRSALERLAYETDFRPELAIVDSLVIGAERQALVAGAAAVVAVHDEPALGLVIGDALSAGVPVVATLSALPHPAWDSLVTLVDRTDSDDLLTAALVGAIRAGSRSADDAQRLFPSP